MYEGYPWDYSFTKSNVVRRGNDRTVEVLEILFQKIAADPFRNKRTLPTVVVVFFCLNFQPDLTEDNDKESDFAHVSPKNLLHTYMYGNSYKRSNPPKFKLCYIEASIAATYFFDLISAVVVCFSQYASKYFNWSISTVEELKTLHHRKFLTYQPFEITAGEILDILEEHPSKYCNNVIFCTDVSVVDEPETNLKNWEQREWKQFKKGALDSSGPVESVSNLLLTMKSSLNVWRINSHKDLAKGAKLFASSFDMEQLPKHDVVG